MKLSKKLCTIMALSLVLTLAIPFNLALNNSIIVEAATIKLNKTKLTLNAGGTSTLKVNGTTKKATWSSSNKAVATVNAKGKITAKKAGATDITATVDGKKYTCKVTVKENSFIKNAPFKGKEAKIGKVSFVIPSTFKAIDLENGTGSIAYYPSKNDINTIATCVAVTALETGVAAPEFSLLKETYTEYYNTFLASLEIDNFEFKEEKNNLGKTFIVNYSLTAEDNVIEYTSYLVGIKNYMIQIDAVNHDGHSSTPDVKTVAEYILKSFTTKK